MYLLRVIITIEMIKVPYTLISLIRICIAVVTDIISFGKSCRGSILINQYIS